MKAANHLNLIIALRYYGLAQKVVLVVQDRTVRLLIIAAITHLLATMLDKRKLISLPVVVGKMRIGMRWKTTLSCK